MGVCFFFCEFFVRDWAGEVVFECSVDVGGGVDQGGAEVFIAGDDEDVGALGEVG